MHRRCTVLGPIDWTSYLHAIRREADALAAAAGLGLDPGVPSCPGWTVSDVVRHTGTVHRHKERIVRERWVDTAPDAEDPPSSHLVDWFNSGVDRLLQTLAATDPLIPAYSWYPLDQTVGFWYRRMAHETAIHRVDAELGHSIANPIDAELAADGIDENLTVMMEGFPSWAASIPDERSARIECTDQPGAWSLRFLTWTGTGPESGTEYRNEPGFLFEVVSDPTVTIRGAASDLDLFLWGRGPRERLTIEGDPGLVDVLRAIAAEATR